jgi:hypothetical protein
MMPRWVWFLPLGVLLLVVAYNGVKLGMIRANVTETAVIDHFAAQYLDDHARAIGPGAALTDCLAVPGTVSGVWLEVRCTPPEGAAFLYGVRRDGALIYAARDGTEPET